jgi:hypothetical protein
MLLYERGNVDLIVFFICAMIAVAANYSANTAALLIVFGAIVKMFPFFGITVLLKESKNKFWTLFSGSLVIFLVYIVATWSSVKASWTTTMRGDGTSYGTNVFVTRYEPAISRAFSQWFTPRQLDLFIRYGPLAVAVVLLLVIMILAFRHQQQPALFTEQNLAAFRMGASIYVGTFLLGNNWDYRLAFLVFVVPQLVDWMFSTDKVYRTLAWLSMFLVLASCWHFWILQISLVPLHLTTADSQRVWIILDETFNWLLFASLAYLMIASIPDWLKTQFGSFLPVKG